MRIYELLLRDYPAKSVFPYKGKHPLGMELNLTNDIIDCNYSKYPLPIKLYYTGLLEGDVIVITPGLDACNSQLKEVLSKYKGIEFLPTVFINIETKQETTEYQIFRPTNMIAGLVNDNISTWSIYGKGEPYEFKSYNTIGLKKDVIEKLEVDMFKIPEWSVSIFIKETLKPIFEKLPMFKLREVAVE